jgi:murein DD-endopeptidase MepM/ murein hydrolase activator NlpD
MLRSRFLPRAVVLALVSVGVAACSADTTRFNDNPFASHGNPDLTASMPQAQTAQAPQLRSATSVAVNSTPAGPGRSGASEVTGSVLRKPTSSGNWSWDGGTAITVAAGETIDTIARRHGVPASVIMQANNITAPATLYPGQRLVIPRYKSSRVASATATAPAPRPAVPTPAVPTPAPAASPPGNGSVHVVAAGDTLSKIAHRYHKSVSEIAKANNLQPTATLNVGDRLTIPGAQPSPVKASASPPAAPAKPVASAAPKEAAPTQNANVVAPTDQLDKEAAKLAEGTGAVPKFRWPANGRIIAGYGPTTNGQQNDGINIALPENTPVKAAEDGVVAYAGNELKGYGNLVLVRHPNGYVTAYAHTKELLVKRGDQVKRGQVIARSGQTGNVNAPQLHFEIRKGASPLDPTRFLNGA